MQGGIELDYCVSCGGNVKYKIVANKSSKIAHNISKSLSIDIITATVDSFADTEGIAKISEPDQIFDNTILLVQQFFFYPKNVKGNSINNQIFNILLLVDLIKKLGSKKIIAVLPYLPYCRHDKSDYGNFLGAISLLERIFAAAGIDEVISVDLHVSSMKKEFNFPLHEVLLTNFWADFLKTSDSKLFDVDDEYCLVSPDMGHLPKAKSLAKILDKNFAYIEKKRVGPDQAKALELVGEVDGKVVVVVDDILDTARTAVNACDMLLKNGAKKIIGCFAHGVLTEGAIERLESSKFEKIFVTNTVQLEDDVKGCDKITILPIDGVLSNFVKSLI
jgi:ribose-phosphate pyrophosphokinase